MRHRPLVRRGLILVMTVLLGTIAGAVSPAPAHANHVITNCNNDPAGIDEIFFEWNNLVFVGVDLGLGDLLGPESRGVCVVVLGVPETVLVDVLDPIPGFVGNTIRVRLCNPTCTTILDQTGVELNLAAPLFSCIYVDGVQQNPGCPF